MERLSVRLANLLTIKSMVTLALTAVFSLLTLRGAVTADQFLTVFTVVIAFYFGTQSEKTNRTDRRTDAAEPQKGTNDEVS